MLACGSAMEEHRRKTHLAIRSKLEPRLEFLKSFIHVLHGTKIYRVRSLQALLEYSINVRFLPRFTAWLAKHKGNFVSVNDPIKQHLASINASFIFVSRFCMVSLQF